MCQEHADQRDGASALHSDCGQQRGRGEHRRPDGLFKGDATEPTKLIAVEESRSNSDTGASRAK
jgi:hypothetical protein